MQLELKNIKTYIFYDLDNILKNSRLKLNKIIDTIDNNSLNRDNYIKEIDEKIYNNIFIIAGDKGVGKSSIVKNIYLNMIINLYFLFEVKNFILVVYKN